MIDATGGAPIPNATVVIVDGKIREISTGNVTIPPGAVRYDLSGRFVMPGLIDAHVHIGNFAAARRALRSGVTTARSAGTGFFADVGLRELARKGDVDSPEIVATGYHVRPRPAEATRASATSPSTPSTTSTRPPCLR